MAFLAWVRTASKESLEAYVPDAEWKRIAVERCLRRFISKTPGA